METFGCACRLEKGNILIDNSKAGELLENNSQWHPGFSNIGSVPGNPPTVTVPPTPQTIAQASAAMIADPDFLDHDESESEDEADEDMDEIDEVDDSFDANLLNNVDEAQFAAFALQSMTNGPTPQAHTANAISYFLEADQISSDSDSDSGAAYSGMPDLEVAPSAPETDEQTQKGIAYLHHNSDQLAD